MLNAYLNSRPYIKFTIAAALVRLVRMDNSLLSLVAGLVSAFGADGITDQKITGQGEN